MMKCVRLLLGIVQYLDLLYNRSQGRGYLRSDVCIELEHVEGLYYALISVYM